MSVAVGLHSESDPVESQWRALAERRENAFLTPEWFRGWLRAYGDEVEPFVPLVRGDDGSLRGLLPLAIDREGHPRACRIAGANLGDRFHPVCEPGDEAEVAAEVGRSLAEPPQPWSVIALTHVQTEPPWLDALAEGTGERVRVRQRIAGPLPYLELGAHEGWEGYLRSRSSNFRQQVRRFRRRAEKAGSMTLRRTERPEELAGDMETFFRLHGLRFGPRGGSTLSSERAQVFHQDFAASALRRGWLRLWFLELDGAPVAAWYGWRLGGRYSYYNSGLDPSRSELRPGLVLLAEVIRSAFEEGATVFDFLLGDEQYKYRFAEAERTVSDVTIARSLPHPAGMLAGAEYAARGLARRLPESVRHRSGLLRLARRRTKRQR
jgi:CelD/BcsL family acetyltransferase involved in cellulose biosynthesis